MDFKIAFNLKVILGNLNKIKADPDVLWRLNYAIARLEDTMKLIEQERKIEKVSMLKTLDYSKIEKQKRLVAMLRTLDYSQN